jgi:hypothetical protein
VPARTLAVGCLAAALVGIFAVRLDVALRLADDVPNPIRWAEFGSASAAVALAIACAVRRVTKLPDLLLIAMGCSLAVIAFYVAVLHPRLIHNAVVLAV